MFFWVENLYRLGHFAIYLGIVQTVFMILKRYIRTLKSFEILSEEKKDYVLKNIFKSCVLFLFIPLASYIIYLFFVENRHDTWWTIYAGWLYSACDIVGLINVKLPRTTLIHHCIVTVFAIISTLMNHDQFSFFTPIILYGSYCAYTFSVNLFLGIRHLYPDHKYTYLLCRISFWIYALIVPVIILSCLYCYYLMFFICNPVVIIGMMGLISMLWRDDFILLGWLRDFYRGTLFYQKNKNTKKNSVE